MFDNAITLEFYVNKDKALCVEYNTKKYLFSEFWQNVPDARKICHRIYKEFERQYPDKYDTASYGAKNWEEIFIKIVNNHFRQYDKFYDVFIRKSGEVTFMLEHD